jgi:hypothetical protein
MDVKEREWEGADWIYLAQDRGQWQGLVNTVIKLLVPQEEENSLNS